MKTFLRLQAWLLTLFLDDSNSDSDSGDSNSDSGDSDSDSSGASASAESSDDSDSDSNSDSSNSQPRRRRYWYQESSGGVSASSGPDVIPEDAIPPISPDQLNPQDFNDIPRH